MIDIGEFKQYNGRLGHQAGDQVLRDLGSLILGSIRKIGLRIRYGGEEFAIVLPATDLNGATKVAESAKKKETTGSVSTLKMLYKGDVEIESIFMPCPFKTHSEKIKAMGPLLPDEERTLYGKKDCFNRR